MSTWKLKKIRIYNERSEAQKGLQIRTLRLGKKLDVLIKKKECMTSTPNGREKHGFHETKPNHTSEPFHRPPEVPLGTKSMPKLIKRLYRFRV